MRFDAHQHFWNVERLDYPILKGSELYRTIEPPTLKPELERAGFEGTVVVQAANDEKETAYLLELAERTPWIAGVVGWVDLADPTAAEAQLAKFADRSKLKGVRHLIMLEDDPDWLVRPNVLEGLRVLASFDLAFDVAAEFPNHLRHVPTIATRVKELRIVVDHLAKPPADAAGAARWRAELDAAADCPNVYGKVSGLRWAEDASYAIGAAFERFGSGRLMFGSDWPVSALTLDYASVVRAAENAVADRPASDVDALFRRTAAAFYRL